MGTPQWQQQWQKKSFPLHDVAKLSLVQVNTVAVSSSSMSCDIQKSPNSLFCVLAYLSGRLYEAQLIKLQREKLGLNLKT